MYNLFLDKPVVSRGIISFPKFLYVRNGLLRELSKVLQYYRTNPRALPGDHFLVRLLGSISVPFGNDVGVYFDRVNDMAMGLSMSLNMTSAINYGETFEPGPFYGPGVSEIILATDEGFDLSQIEDNWRELQPIRVLRHDITNLNLEIPDGYPTEKNSGIAVIEVNIPMLACQYRQFRWEQAQRPDGEAELTMEQFLRMYPLPNMLMSHVDYALFNYFRAAVFGTDLEDLRPPHSFYLIRYDEKLMEIMFQAIDAFSKREYPYQSILETLPGAVNESMLGALMMPETAPTRQIEWALDIARLPAVEVLVSLTGSHGGNKNREMYNYLRRWFRRTRSDSAFRKVLPRDLNITVQALLEGIETQL